jgi:hypothetical protein
MSEIKSSVPLLDIIQEIYKKEQFNSNDTDILETFFQEKKYPEMIDLNRLSIKLNMSITKIRIWFRNRRAKAKKNGESISRCVFSLQDNILLEHLFSTNMYPTAKQADNLSRKMGVQFTNIKDWFQNRRGKFRKDTRVFSIESLKILENCFIENPYPEKDQIQILSRVLNMNYLRLRRWFEVRRLQDSIDNTSINRTKVKMSIHLLLNP